MACIAPALALDRLIINYARSSWSDSEQTRVAADQQHANGVVPGPKGFYYNAEQESGDPYDAASQRED